MEITGDNLNQLLESTGAMDGIDEVKIENVLPEEYFKSYEDLDVHRLMLEDKVRTNSYMNAIYKSKELFQGKTVMDVGAGTGILSLFCAKAGAKTVFAVEASNLAYVLPKTVEKNGFSDIIKVIHSKVEDVVMEDRVDIIVSEWMGFYLLHESMLDSVIHARDNFLKPNTGLMFPNSAKIFAAICTLPELWEKQCRFWTEKQYGFDMSPIADIARLKTKPEIHSVPGDALLSDPQLLWSLDLLTVDAKSLQNFSDRRFFTVDGDGEIHGVCVWFTCAFPIPSGSSDEDAEDDDTELSTAPWTPETHWKQTVLLFPEPVPVEDGDIFGWNFKMEKDSLESSSRSYKLHLELLGNEEEHPVPCLCGSVKCEIIRHHLNSMSTKFSGADLTGDLEPIKT